MAVGAAEHWDRAAVDGLNRLGGTGLRHTFKQRRIAYAAITALSVGGASLLAACQPIKTASSSLAPWQPTASAYYKLARPVGGVNQDGLVVRERDSGRVIPATLLCKNGGSDVACSAARINAISILPAAPFTAGQYYTVSFAPRLLDSSGKPPITGDTVFRAGPRVEDAGANTAYTWAPRTASGAFGGSYTVESRKEGRAGLNFHGPWVKVWAVTGPTGGLMDIYIDHVLRKTFNTYSAKTRLRVPVVVEKLSGGNHRLDIVVRGAKGTKASRGTDVAVDAVATQGGTAATPAFEYDWGHDTSPSFSGGWTSSSQTIGAVVGITFRGSAIDVATVRGPWSGIYRAYLDHKSVGEFSDGSATFGVGTRRFTAATDGVHLLQLVVTGRHTKWSTAAVVALDYWQLPVTLKSPTLRDGSTQDQSWGREQYLPASVPAPPTASAPPVAETSGATR